MAWLEKLATGEFYDNTLPPVKKDDDGTTGQTGESRFGGNKKYTSIY